MQAKLLIWNDDHTIRESVDLPSDDLVEADDWIQQLVRDTDREGSNWEIIWEPTFEDLLEHEAKERFSLLNDDGSTLGIDL